MVLPADVVAISALYILLVDSSTPQLALAPYRYRDCQSQPDRRSNVEYLLKKPKNLCRQYQSRRSFYALYIRKSSDNKLGV
ncbi:hypothetical protein BDW71DRAFT_193205 [Aspergillus fruticulosus]